MRPSVKSSQGGSNHEADQFLHSRDKLLDALLGRSAESQPQCRKRPGIRTRVITLVTTLLDAEQYPAAELATLYLSRWRIEINFRHLKTTMKMEVLHCHSVVGVLKELYLFAVAYNLVRLVMLAAARRQDVPVERISFIDALRWLRDATPTTPLTPLVVNPERLNRFEPRVLKRRTKKYPLMTKPRDVLRKALLRKKVTA